MATLDPNLPGPRRFSTRLSRLLCIALAMIVLVLGVGLQAGLSPYRQQATVPATKPQADFSSLMKLITTSEAQSLRLSEENDRQNSDTFVIALFTLGCAVSAVAIWLTIRMINGRRKLSTKIWSIGLLTMIVAYPLSFGPACWMNERTNANATFISTVFYPIVRLANQSPRVSVVALWYAGLGAREGTEPSFDGDKIGWWIPGPASMTYRVILCTGWPESIDQSSEVSAQEIKTEDEPDEGE